MIKILTFFFVLLFYSSAGQLFKYQATITNNSGACSALATKPDGSLLLEGDEGGYITLRNISTGEMGKKMKSHSSKVNTIDFNSTGNLLISTTQAGEIKVYDFVKGKIVNSLVQKEYSGMNFALFSIADGFVYFNSQGRLYKTRSDLTQEIKNIFEFSSNITTAIATPDRGAILFAVGSNIKVLDTRTDEIRQDFFTGRADVQKLFLMSNERVMSWSSDGSVNIWKFTTGQLTAPALVWFKAGNYGNVAFSHDGKWMVSGNIATLARIWEPMEKNILQELQGHGDVVTSFAFSNDDQTLFTASNDKTIMVWKQKLDSIPAPVLSHNDSILIAKATKKAIAAGKDPTLPDPVYIEHNIPWAVGTRDVKKADQINVKKSSIDIYIYDNRKLDGDTMSLCFNGKWLLAHYAVQHKKKKVTLQLKPGTNNYLILYADNLGESAPNTAAIEFKDGNDWRTVRLDSDLKKCHALNFVFKKK